MQNFSTPMMQQYQKIKSQYMDCLLLFRLGDFYELFLEDAKIGSEVLGITLTSRPKGKDGRIPMAGVPYHAVDNYISKLIKAGYKVAICEQVSEPDKYGIVDREVIRVVTPGTVMDEKSLEKKENNFVISVLVEGSYLGVSSADISTGMMQTFQTEFENLESCLSNKLANLNPSECILPPSLYNNPQILRILKKQNNLNIYCFFEWDEAAIDAAAYLKNHFGIKSLDSFNISDKALSIKTSAALIAYLKGIQKDNLAHIKKITTTESDKFVSLDRSTIINLEIFSTIREHDTRGTLLSVVDQTLTSMGGRLLKDWLKHPLRDKRLITQRHQSVAEFVKKPVFTEEIRKILEGVNDVERILSRLSVGVGNARDLVNLKESLKKIIQIKHKLVDSKVTLTSKIQSSISVDLQKTIQLIETNILEEPAVSLKDGGIIKDGVNKQLDHLRKTINKGNGYIIELENKEKKRSGINSLKIRFNQVFGYYIEVSRGNAHLVPEDFMRKQTLVNAERFITQELKSYEETILTAKENVASLEYEVYQQVLDQVLSFIQPIQNACKAVATLDTLMGFAHVAEQNNYACPKIIYSGEIKIKKGRHPVVEKLLEDTEFVPNNLELNNINKQLLIITGPNMAGKSVFIRQVALIVLLSQIGSFVPASSAHISIVDKIFVRSGASDVITSGLSTFMVEMVETAYILNHATKNSLIVMDEIGRGTSTYDGISIAWAVAEYLVTSNKYPPKTLFATHYHELQELEKKFPQKIKNFHLTAIEENGEPVFLHTVLPGGASHSFGVAVAKLAGIPQAVIKNAYQILASLENRNSPQPVAQKEEKLKKHLQKIDLNQVTPIEALNYLSRLKKKL